MFVSIVASARTSQKLQSHTDHAAAESTLSVFMYMCIYIPIRPHLAELAGCFVFAGVGYSINREMQAALDGVCPAGAARCLQWVRSDLDHLVKFTNSMLE